MNKINIAIVDDHTLFRTGLSQILNQVDDFNVVLESTNGKEFLKALPENNVDVVLLDIQMPELDGIQVTQELRKNDNQEPKIIILSMHDEDHFILHLLELGANGYLLKDTDPDEVETAIRKVNENGIYFTDFVSRVMLKKATMKKQPTSGMFFNYKKDISERELQVLTFICQGLTMTEIGVKMCISHRTVEGHRTRIMEKLKVNNTASLVAYAIKNELIVI